MKIKYRGKKLGWRIYLNKGSIQIDLKGKSKHKGYACSQVACWDDSQNGFFAVQQYNVNGELCCAVSNDSFDGLKQINENYYFVNEKMIHECNNPMTCEAVKRYMKDEKK